MNTNTQCAIMLLSLAAAACSSSSDGWHVSGAAAGTGSTASGGSDGGSNASDAGGAANDAGGVRPADGGNGGTSDSGGGVGVGVDAGAFSALSVSGNRLVNAEGDTVVLHGVNRSGTEYACIQGNGVFDGPDVTNDDSQVPLIASWGANELNFGVNEDCWLDVNTSGLDSSYLGANYISAIVHEVHTLESHSIYPVISLFWMAPGTQQATGQNSMPDNDHSPALWQSLATTFKDDPLVIFRLKEEPYPGNNGDSADIWSCWENGDVQYDTSNTLTPVSSNSNCSEGFPAVGMQSLINIIRGTGAKNVIQVPGIQYANTMDQFLTYLPSDPLHNLMGVVDVYPAGNPCGSTSCYDSQYAPVIDVMPLMGGEIGSGVSGSCTTSDVDTLIQWFDQHNSGYAAWDWDTWGGCLQLVNDYTSGDPTSPGARITRVTSCSSPGSDAAGNANWPLPQPYEKVFVFAQRAVRYRRPRDGAPRAWPPDTRAPGRGAARRRCVAGACAPRGSAVEGWASCRARTSRAESARGAARAMSMPSAEGGGPWGAGAATTVGCARTNGRV